MSIHSWRVDVGSEAVVNPYAADNAPDPVKRAIREGRDVGLMWRVTTEEGSVLVGGLDVDDTEGFPWSDTDGVSPLTSRSKPGFVTETGTVTVAFLGVVD